MLKKKILVLITAIAVVTGVSLKSRDVFAEEISKEEKITLINSEASNEIKNVTEDTYEEYYEINGDVITVILESRPSLGDILKNVDVSSINTIKVETNLCRTFEDKDYIYLARCNIPNIDLSSSKAEDKVLFHYFCGSTNDWLKTIKLPQGIEELGDSAFAWCKSLEKIYFPTTLKTIEKFAFGSSHVLNLVIPDTVEYIGDYAFYEAVINNLELTTPINNVNNTTFTKSNIKNLTVTHSAFTSIRDYLKDCDLEKMNIKAYRNSEVKEIVEYFKSNEVKYSINIELLTNVDMYLIQECRALGITIG